MRYYVTSDVHSFYAPLLRAHTTYGHRHYGQESEEAKPDGAGAEGATAAKAKGASLEDAQAAPAAKSTVCYEPFYADGLIAIDAATVLSGRVNCLVLED